MGALGAVGVSEAEKGAYVAEIGLGRLEAAVPVPGEGAAAAVPRMEEAPWRTE